VSSQLQPTNKTISRAALTAELGPTLARKALSHVGTGGRIPNFEELLPGDVILSRNLDAKGNVSPSNVRFVQKSLKQKKFSEDNLTWTHTMMYVGGMHVAESQFIKKKEIWVGLRVVPLTIYSQNVELLICRHKALEGGMEAAQYALLNCIAERRGYPLGRMFFP
jgi:hypothetical protein